MQRLRYRLFRKSLHALRVAAALGFGGVLVALSTCSPGVTLLEELQHTGELRVAMINREGSYYTGPDNAPDGFDYVLVRDFAAELDLELNILQFTRERDALQAVESGQAHFAAAGLAASRTRQRKMRFTPPLREVTPQVIYQRGSYRPRNADDVNDVVIVTDGTATADVLRNKFDETFSWETTADHDAQALASQVGEGVIPLAAIPSDVTAINRRYFPKLAIAFNLTDPLPVAWAFPDRADSSLLNRAIAFIERQRASGELARTADRYFGQLGRLDYVGSRAFSRDVTSRLPRYEALFKAAAEEQGLDWRLLAAVGYQESRWDPNAKSPTGVRGLMMLTRDTARYLRVDDRLDPAQSIAGGARYLRQQINRLPETIDEPDRTWLALAAYNLGLGHVLDGRRLTEELEGDPDRWVDVRGNLPLLAQSRWHKQTRHGYARGHEAVTYVGNIRTYFDILAWLSSGETDAVPQTVEVDQMPEPDAEDERPAEAVLEIDSPIL